VTKDGLPLAPAPELIFGLVGPIGVDLDTVTTLLEEALTSVGYNVDALRVTKLMREIPASVVINENPHYIDSFRERIAYANEVRDRLQRSDAMAILAISAIRELRKQKGGDEEKPIPRQAYIIRQFKRPEEIKLLRSVYGRQFVQISAYAPQKYRIDRIAAKERASRRGLLDEVDAATEAYKLVMQDEREELNGGRDFGQNVRDAFPLGDVFIDTVDRTNCRATLLRFINALFGNNEIGPTHDEYGMYVAKSASLRSAALTRQVGAAVFKSTGEIISMGCNEVPKSGGGTYWSEDPNDRRDIVEGHDPNEQKKNELLADLIDRLLSGGHLSVELSELGSSPAICNALLTHGRSTVKDSKVMDLLEFGRDIHAEMSAICDAARNGLSLGGAALYTTTFPCHLCAKHIVASGIRRVVYLEPYPKSYARELHQDSIVVEGSDDTKRVNFTPFIGISPYRYRDLFEKGRRKYGGSAQQWNRGEKRPMIEVYYSSYFQAEVDVVNLIKQKLDEFSA
jgi:deoxycytidylate deaminase